MFILPEPEDDGMLIPEVGEWSKDKHYFLLRYIDAFSNAMKKKNWAGLHYIDLFAGAGLERLRDSGKLEWGSPLIAAHCKYFSGLHLCEIDSVKYSALQTRVNKFDCEAQILYGDANDKIHDIIKQIPNRSLSLAFLDPYGLHLEYKTLQILANKRADLVIFFPDHLDVIRNWEKYYFDNPESILDHCLGTGQNWRKIFNETPRDKLAETIRKLYVEQLSKLGYTEFEYERIYMKGRPLYCLIFCAQHKVAAKIWRGISGKKPDGQRTFDFG